jgi:hypothetical protein
MGDWTVVAGTLGVTVTFSLINIGSLIPGSYTATIAFTNASNGHGNTTRTATLTVNPGTKDGCNIREQHPLEGLRQRKRVQGVRLDFKHELANAV